MRTVATVTGLRTAVAGWKAGGLRVGLVPTMGNLHDGHLSLIAHAKRLADRVVASVFVNPLQFGPDEDYDAYPRTPRDDETALREAGCDLLYMPSVAEMYPAGETQTRIAVGAVGGLLCGAHRPGHFDGMATVVVKLLNQAAPDVAVFGQKDYQQLVVIRQVVSDLDLPVVIEGAPTVREPDGLAMSSRNRYLDETQREQAPQLQAILRWVARALVSGRRDFAALQDDASERLRGHGFDPDYVEIRTPALAEPGADTDTFVVLAAAHLGRARLIDNLLVET